MQLQQSNIRDQNDARGNPKFTGNRSQADTIWQGAAGSHVRRGGNGAFSQRYDAGVRGMVRILRCRQTALGESMFAAGDRNGFVCRGELHLYARRWSIEPLFHNLKRWWGVNNLWQLKRTVLELFQLQIEIAIILVI